MIYKEYLNQCVARKTDGSLMLHIGLYLLGGENILLKRYLKILLIEIQQANYAYF